VGADLGAIRKGKALAQVEPYVLPHLPCGFMLRLSFYSTWGDPYYLGLNGLQLLGADGSPLPLAPSNVFASPSSIAEIPAMRGDVRTLDKLVDGVNDTYDDGHMWLAPWTPPRNVLWVVLDSPVVLSGIKVWNYAKTPERGAQHVQIHLDDCLIFDGLLRKAPPCPAAGVVAPARSFAQSILFSAAADLVAREGEYLWNAALQGEQDIVFTNDRPTNAPLGVVGVPLGVSSTAAVLSSGAPGSAAAASAYPKTRPDTTAHPKL
jgi:hypothetical protein